MNVDRLILVGVVFLTMCRFFLASQLELTPNEALWWMESGRLSAVSFDHGPILPGLIKLSTWALGDHVLAVRLWNPLLIVLASYWLYLLARSACQQTAARWTVVLFHLTPWPNWAAIADLQAALAMTFVFLAMWLFWCALHRANRWHWTWFAAGLALGAAVLTYFPLALLGITPLFVLLVIPRWQGHWRRPGIYLMLGAAAVLVTAFLSRPGPPVLPNLLSLTVERTLRNTGFHFTSLIVMLVTQIFLTGPLAAAGWVWLARRWRQTPCDAGRLFLAVITLGPAGSLLFLALFFGERTPVWWLGLAPGLILLVDRWMQSDLAIRTKTRWRTLTLTSSALLTCVMLNTDNLRFLGWPWSYERDPSSAHRGWIESAKLIETSLEKTTEHHGEAPFLIAATPESAALLEFYLSPEAKLWTDGTAKHPLVHVPEASGLDHVYHLWPNYSHREASGASAYYGRAALFVTQEPNGDLPHAIRHGFKSTDLTGVVTIRRKGRLLRTWHLYRCHPYEGLPR